MMPNQDMSLLLTLPSEDLDHQNAFTIINHDLNEKINLNANETIRKTKVINIVKPVRRTIPNDPNDVERNTDIRRNVSASTDHLNRNYNANRNFEDSSTNQRRNHSQSLSTISAPQTILDPTFSRALDLKLRQLKEKQNVTSSQKLPNIKHTKKVISASHPNINIRNHRPISKNISLSNPNVLEAKIVKLELPNFKEHDSKTPTIGATTNVSPGRSYLKLYKWRPTKPIKTPEGKPRFWTIVKTGEFLLPPPAMATRLGLQSPGSKEIRDRKMVYTYASKPNVVPPGGLKNRSKLGSHQSRCSAAGIVGMMKTVAAAVAGMQTHEIEQKLRSKRHIDGSKDMPYTNVMYDRRVVRGSTYAQHPLNFGDGESAAARAAETRRRNQQRRKERQLQRPTSPPAVPGRRHEPIQTDAYLEELFDKGEEMTTGTQTDLFLDRPATPIYVPAKTGCDASTQIGAGDLFDFDLEVQPILEVLVGKTCEQALIECLEEEELEALREQQRRFRELRDAETAEKQRLDEQNRRLEEEKERRIESGKEGLAAQKATAERVAAAALVQGYIADLLPAVLDGLKEQGYLFERTKRCVDETFLPWLMVEVTQEIESMITSRDILTEIVREVIEQRVDRYRCVGELEAMLQDTRVSSSSESEAEENLDG